MTLQHPDNAHPESGTNGYTSDLRRLGGFLAPRRVRPSG